jgi:hypothetical protein
MSMLHLNDHTEPRFEPCESCPAAPEPPGEAWSKYELYDLALIDDWQWQGNPPPPPEEEEFAP